MAAHEDLPNPTLIFNDNHGDSSLTFIGDYFGIDASRLGFYPFWTDTRTGVQEIFCSRLSPNPADVYVRDSSTDMGSATALTDCELLRIDKKAMMLALHREHTFSDLFVAYLLARNIRYEEDLVDQLFNSSEKRLARLLLLLAHFGKEGAPEIVIPKISQETLAEMIGTTRSRVSFFMNRFRKLGFLDYGESGLQVHSSLLNVVLHD